MGIASRHRSLSGYFHHPDTIKLNSLTIERYRAIAHQNGMRGMGAIASTALWESLS
ncbi:MAG: hypothetical protein F6K09_23280 [Merismopedia sp. SIO2A8]|nr:hypothetical protein [Merismopedia sp. SIO2A8]